MGLKPKAKATGPSKQDIARQDEADRKATEAENNANEKLSSTQAAAVKSRTGRRLLLAPGREDEIGKLSGSSGGF